MDMMDRRFAMQKSIGKRRLMVKIRLCSWITVGAFRGTARKKKLWRSAKILIKMLSPLHFIVEILN
jgi:hypothetical protein